MRKLLFLLIAVSTVKTYSQKKNNQIFFDIDTSQFNKHYCCESAEVYFENKILKSFQSDSLNNRNLEFIRIDNKNYYLSITNNSGAVLEKGKVSISKKPFRTDSPFKWFYFQKNGYWQESLTDSIYKSGVYKYNEKVGTWTNILRSSFTPLTQEIYKADTILSSKNLNQLQADTNVILKNIIGIWKTDIWDYSKQFWTFIKMNEKENAYSKITIQFDSNYTAKSISRHQHGSATQNYKWRINNINKAIRLEDIDKNSFIEIVYLNDNFFLLNSKPKDM